MRIVQHRALAGAAGGEIVREAERMADFMRRELLQAIERHAHARAIDPTQTTLPESSFDIVIDAYRIETLKPYQLGVGSGMSQYGWRIGSAGAGALALVLADQKLLHRAQCG